MQNRYLKYLQPIHFIKKYFGEEFAFYYYFYLTYVRALIIPAVGGIALSYYNYTEYRKTGIRDTSIDTQWNAVYGILLAIWSSVFVEEWRNKEKQLVHTWDLEGQKTLIMNDETKSYKYNYEYDPDANTKIKTGMQRPWWVKPVNYLFTAFILAIAIMIMLFFSDLTYEDPDEKKDPNKSFITILWEKLDYQGVIYAEVI